MIKCRHCKGIIEGQHYTDSVGQRKAHLHINCLTNAIIKDIQKEYKAIGINKDVDPENEFTKNTIKEMIEDFYVLVEK
jgi:hypothetical protein